jgi:hypothetical protein
MAGSDGVEINRDEQIAHLMQIIDKDIRGLRYDVDRLQHAHNEHIGFVSTLFYDNARLERLIKKQYEQPNVDAYLKFRGDLISELRSNVTNLRHEVARLKEQVADRDRKSKALGGAE